MNECKISEDIYEYEYVKSEWRLLDQPNGNRINSAAAREANESRGGPMMNLLEAA